MKLKTKCNNEFEIDDNFYQELSKHNTLFMLDKKGHIYLWSKILKSTIHLARLVLGCPFDNGFDAEHKDRNGCNNKAENLRWATFNQNRANSAKSKGKYTSKYKGVGWSIEKSKWRAYITHNYKYIHLGYFISEIDAAKAYDKKAIELFGEFALLNFLYDRDNNSISYK